MSTGLIRHIDEEITTAALLGAMASNIAWASALALGSELPPLSWVHYSKHKKGQTSESFTGADFSIIFRLDKNRYRAAVFQAKRAQSEKLNFKHLQISPAVGEYHAEPQILRLRNYGLKLLSNSKNPAGRSSALPVISSDLAFVHYLIYHQHDAYCSHLGDHSQDIDNILAMDTNVKSRNIVDIDGVRDAWKSHADRMIYPTKSSCTSLDKLFWNALTTPLAKMAPGWLDLNKASAARSFIHDTRVLMDVFEGSESVDLKSTLNGGINLAGMAFTRQPLLKAALPLHKVQSTHENISPRRRATRQL